MINLQNCGLGGIPIKYVINEGKIFGKNYVFKTDDNIGNSLL